MLRIRLRQVIERTHWLIHQQANGLSHEDSMLRLPFWDNSMNWVIGHIIHYRDQVLRELGESPVLTEADTAIYGAEGGTTYRCRRGYAAVNAAFYPGRNSGSLGVGTRWSCGQGNGEDL